LSAGAIPAKLGAGASVVVADFADGVETPLLITMGCASTFVAGALFATGAEGEGLDVSASLLTLPGWADAFSALAVIRVSDIAFAVPVAF